MVQQLLQTHPTLDPSVTHQAFIEAAQNGEQEIVQLLLHTAPPPTQSVINLAFIEAAQRGEEKIVQLLLEQLLEQRPTPKAIDDALIEAAEAVVLYPGFHPEQAVPLLLEAGPTPKAIDDALIAAALWGGKEIVQLLLNTAPPPTQTVIAQALEVAARHGENNEVSQMLSSRHSIFENKPSRKKKASGPPEKCETPSKKA